MAEAKATEERVRTAVIKLLLEGKEPSTRNVCTITGGGNTTIGPLIVKAFDAITTQNIAGFALSPDFLKSCIKEIGRHLMGAREEFDQSSKHIRMLLEEAQQDLIENIAKLDNASADLKTKDQQVSELTSQMVSISTQNSLLKQQLHELKEERQSMLTRNEQIIRDGSMALQALKAAQQKANEDAKQIREIQNKNSSLERELQKSHAKVNIFAERLDTLQKRVETLGTEKEKAESEARSWLNKLHELQKEHGCLRERIAIAETKLSKPDESSESPIGHTEG
ncbi:MAG: DNA-binding protein [Dehalobacter sp.]|nr:DNA-binding protein [Dehalobacter sp.]